MHYLFEMTRYWVTLFLLRIRFIACICRRFFVLPQKVTNVTNFEGYSIVIVEPFLAIWVCPYRSLKEAHILFFLYTYAHIFEKGISSKVYLIQKHNLAHISKSFYFEYQVNTENLIYGAYTCEVLYLYKMLILYPYFVFVDIQWFFRKTIETQCQANCVQRSGQYCYLCCRLSFNGFQFCWWEHKILDKGKVLLANMAISVNYTI
jgi:hypothetical protein